MLLFNSKLIVWTLYQLCTAAWYRAAVASCSWL